MSYIGSAEKEGLECLKGLYHEINILRSLILINMSFLYMRWWFFTIFVSLLLKKPNSKFCLLLWNYWLILKILPVTRFKDPKMAIWTLKMRTGIRLWLCKIIPEARWQSNYCAFSLQPMRGRHWRTSNQSQRREFWGGFQQAFSKLVWNIKEANKIMCGSEKLLKDLKNH